MFYFILLLTPLIVSALDRPNWMDTPPLPDDGCSFVIGRGVSADSSNEARALASKRALHDGVRKILETENLQDFNYEARLTRGKDGETFEEIKSQRYPNINSNLFQVKDNFWHETDEGFEANVLLCYDPVRLAKIAPDQSEDATTIEVTIDSSPHVWQVSTSLFDYETPVTLYLTTGVPVQLEFFHSKGRSVKVTYVPRKSDHRTVKVFSLDIDGKAERPEPSESPSQETQHEADYESAEVGSSEYLGITWDLSVSFLGPTIKKTGNTSGVGLNFRYEITNSLDLGFSFNSGKWEKQGDGLNRYSFKSYGFDMKYRLPFEEQLLNGRARLLPYLRYGYIYWDQQIEQSGTFISGNEGRINSNSHNASLGLEIGRNEKGGVRFFVEYQRIFFNHSSEPNLVRNAGGIMLGFGTGF